MMPSWPQILIVAIVVIILFGRGRISEMMGDFGKGISSFKKGMSEDVEDTPATSAQIEAPAKEAGAPEATTKEAGDTAKS